MPSPTGPRDEGATARTAWKAQTAGSTKRATCRISSAAAREWHEFIDEYGYDPTDLSDFRDTPTSPAVVGVHRHPGSGLRQHRRPTGGPNTEQVQAVLQDWRRAGSASQHTPAARRAPQRLDPRCALNQRASRGRFAGGRRRVTARSSSSSGGEDRPRSRPGGLTCRRAHHGARDDRGHFGVPAGTFVRREADAADAYETAIKNRRRADPPKRDLAEEIEAFLVTRPATAPEIARAIGARDSDVRHTLQTNERFTRAPAAADRSTRAKPWMLASSPAGVGPADGTSTRTETAVTAWPRSRQLGQSGRSTGNGRRS